jgi:hypothetical protein
MRSKTSAQRMHCSYRTPEDLARWPPKESIMTGKDQGIVRDNRGEEQPVDKERAQNVTSVEEKAKNEKTEQKD